MTKEDFIKKLDRDWNKFMVTRPENMPLRAGEILLMKHAFECGYAAAFITEGLLTKEDGYAALSERLDAIEKG